MRSRVAPHENVRIAVVELLKQLYRNIVQHYVRITQRREYHLLETLLNTPEFLPLLMPQEIYISDQEKERVDMAFGGDVVFDFKGKVSEFDDAEEKALKVYLTSPRFSQVKYYIITNYDVWRILEVKRQKGRISLRRVLEDGDRLTAERILKTQILPEVRPLLPAHPDIVSRLFTIDAERLVNELLEIYHMSVNEPRVKPLYSAYEKIMKILYGKAEQRFYAELFSRHTLMHVIILASLSRALGIIGKPEDICSGNLLPIDIAVPYLNWWRMLYFTSSNENVIQKISNIVGEVVLRVNLLDWTHGEAEDVFRMLYELLVDEATRKRIGEYFTPIWLAEYLVQSFDLKNKVILDPFCGSGTFLVVAFHKKVEAGENPDEAYESIIGFDINPLAVAIARSELVLAYLRRTQRPPKNPPHIYHTDTLAMWFGGETVGVPEVEQFFRSAKEFADMLVNFGVIKIENVKQILHSLSLIENSISKALRYSFHGRHEKDLEMRYLKDLIFKHLTSELAKFDDPSVKYFLEHTKETNLAERLAQLLIKYGGNSVWGLIIGSIYAPVMLSYFKPHVILTNPPWIPTTEYQAAYADKLRKVLASYLKELVPSPRVAQIVAGSDVATAALAKSLELTQEGVGFVMNREQSFYHRTSMPAGILVTYSILRNYPGLVKLVDVDFDAFQHGVLPALVIAKRGASKGQQLGIMKLSDAYRQRYSKNLHLVSDMILYHAYQKAYDAYVLPSISYFTQDFNILSRELEVDNIIPKGQYVMGLFGGEHESTYAGIVLLEKESTKNSFKFRLHNTSRSLEVPTTWLQKYDINLYDLIYVGEVFPFKIRRILKILLSRKNQASLRHFLMEALNANLDKLTSDDVSKIKGLISEVRQPANPATLNEGKWYVIYRCDRAFTAATIRPTTDTILDSHLSAIKCSSEKVADYYTAVLNYLAYKVITQNRTFIHHQFARPVLAITIAGLSYKNIEQSFSDNISKLSKMLKNRIKAQSLIFSNQRSALQHIAHFSEFRQIIQLIDTKISRDALEEALNLVSGSKRT
ncbi:hypothetical protein DRO64_01860 [Candidatus Bathyarchaeota archaeon]|nr:MAG: hypothetical protein DRO64_01860 [Candidatus Bathyarchaeota archaeon]